MDGVNKTTVELETNEKSDKKPTTTQPDVDNEQQVLISSLKAYHKMCTNKDHRSVVLKDPTFRKMIVSLLTDERIPVLTYLVKFLLQLTERKEDAVLLTEVSSLEKSLNDAAEKEGLAPNIAHNLLVIASRLKSARTQVAAGDRPVTAAKTSEAQVTTHRFVSRKSKEIVFEFDAINEVLRTDLERRATQRRGVISVYVDLAKRRAVLRVTLMLEPSTLIDDFFDAGIECVSQVLRTTDGREELHTHYASERHNKKEVKMPDYLDDHLLVTNPNECIITQEQAAKAQSAGGWFSSVFRSLW